MRSDHARLLHKRMDDVVARVIDSVLCLLRPMYEEQNRTACLVYLHVLGILARLFVVYPTQKESTIFSEQPRAYIIPLVLTLPFSFIFLEIHSLLLHVLRS